MPDKENSKDLTPPASSDFAAASGHENSDGGALPSMPSGGVSRLGDEDSRVLFEYLQALDLSHQGGA